MIELINLTKYYGKNKAVDGVNISVNGGDIFGLLGPNGAGKTTIIKMITKVIPSDCGNILINGKDINKESYNIKKQIGYVPDDCNLFLPLKGIEYLNFVANMYNIKTEKRIERIDYYSRKLDMHNVLNSKILSYSHGMRKKIILIGSLLHDPNIWILDEPLTALDPESAFILKDIIKEYANEGKIVLFSTHVLDVAEKLCNKIAIINKGILNYNGKFDTNIYKDSLEKMYMELIKNG